MSEKKRKHDEKKGVNWTLVLALVAGMVVCVVWLVAGEALRQVATWLAYGAGGVAGLGLLLGLSVLWAWAHKRRAEYRRDAVLAAAAAEQAAAATESAWLDVDAKRLLVPLMAQQVALGRALPTQMAGIQTVAYPLPGNGAGSGPVMALPAGQPELLPAILPMQRILVVGGQGAGKTTLMQWIAHHRLQQGKVLLLDSHDYPAKWPRGCAVVGNGRRYQHIAEAMRSLVALMDQRYKDYSAGRVGERQHPLITTMADEWTLLPEYIPEVGEFLGPILTESRKVGIDLVLGTHSETAGALGLKGRYDLKRSFDVVVRLRNVKGRRFALADFGEGEVEYALPGPFVVAGEAAPKAPGALGNGQGQAGELADVVAAAEASSTRPEPTPRERTVIEMYQNSASLNQISKAINDGRTGGTYNTEIRSILEKFGIS